MLSDYTPISKFDTDYEDDDHSHLVFVFIATQLCKDMSDSGLIHFTLDPITKEPTPYTDPVIQDIIHDATKALYHGLIKHVNEHLPPSTPIQNPINTTTDPTDPPQNPIL